MFEVSLTLTSLKIAYSKLQIVAVLAPGACVAVDAIITKGADCAW
jgi:hypothetical protein